MSTMTTSAPEPLRLVDGRCAATDDRVARLAEDGHVDLLAEHPQLLDGGRPLEVGADEQRVAALLLNQRASLPAAVVLPEPWRPASSTTVGGFEA